jgi:5-(carboxyamino)imidazole ribonucleotide synthase
MEQLVTSEFKLGIIAGGQLGKMLALAASQWDVKTYVLDSDCHCPASTVCTHFAQGDYTEYDAVYEFGRQVDMITFEIENVNVDALRRLHQEGKRIYPNPDILAVIQDKGMQKYFFRENNIPSPEFTLCEGRGQVLNEIEQCGLEFPFVQKARTAGYDGKGVSVVRCEDDLCGLLDVPCVIERAVDIKKELAVIVARNGKGEIACFPAVEMVFNEQANLVEMLVSPAQIESDLHEKASDLARILASKFDIQGVMAVELFLDKRGKLWVNEVAPRPHNSGHHTIESALVSQYEQHLRAIFDFPLGSTDLVRPAVMINLLGDGNHTGNVKYEGLTETMSIPGAKIHIYGKKQTHPFRKMGHITIIASTIQEAKENAAKMKEIVKVKS